MFLSYDGQVKHLTLVRAICFVLISSGGILTTYTTIKYHKMLRYNRAERYGGKRPFHRLETISELTFVFFIVGYAVGATHVLFWDVENIYLFIGFVFFIASLFLFAMINVLISLEDSLRAKTMEVMLAFVNSIEMKDSYTQGHSWHVYLLSRCSTTACRRQFSRRSASPSCLMLLCCTISARLE